MNYYFYLLWKLKFVLFYLYKIKFIADHHIISSLCVVNVIYNFNFKLHDDLDFTLCCVF